MSLPQQKFREIVFQLLYSADLAQGSRDATTAMVMKEVLVTKKTVKEAWERVDQILKELPSIDAAISDASQSYRFERIQSIERNVLRIGVYEILYDAAIPPKVAISEAVRLAKKFGTPEATAFVNAILDLIYKTHEGETGDTQHLKETVEALEKRDAFIEESLSSGE